MQGFFFLLWTNSRNKPHQNCSIMCLATDSVLKLFIFAKQPWLPLENCKLMENFANSLCKPCFKISLHVNVIIWGFLKVLTYSENIIITPITTEEFLRRFKTNHKALTNWRDFFTLTLHTQQRYITSVCFQTLETNGMSYPN